MRLDDTIVLYKASSKIIKKLPNILKNVCASA